MTSSTRTPLVLCVLTCIALVHCQPSAMDMRSGEPAVEDADPNALTWIAPTTDATIEEQDAVELTLYTLNPEAHVVHFAVDGAEIGVCDPFEADTDCYDANAQTWRWTWLAAGVGMHTFTVNFTADDGHAVSATRTVSVLATGTVPAVDDPESSESEADPVTADQRVFDGTARIAQSISAARGYLDPDRDWHSAFGGIEWRVQAQRVLLRTSRLDGSVGAVADCMLRYGASIRRYADLQFVSRASVVATLLTESNCSIPANSPTSAASGPMQVTASACAAITGLSRSVCRTRMRSSDFSIDVGIRYMASGYQRRQHRNDPPMIAAAYNAGSLRTTRANRWHMFSTRLFVDHWVAAYNAYRTWESTVATPAPIPMLCPGVTVDSTGVTGASAAIQQCLDATPAGGTLEIPAGIYRVDAQIHIDRAITFRTAGLRTSGANCLDAGISCATLQAASDLDVENGMLVLTAPDHVLLDHIVLDGNREARLWSMAAVACASGTNNRKGFNAMNGGSANSSFTHSASIRALCGTGFEWQGDGAVITGSVFRDNGQNSARYMWADGLTLLHSDGALVEDNRFENNSDVAFIAGGARGATFRNNVIVQSTQVAFAGLMLDNFNGGTTGDFTGTTVSGNSIDCTTQLCHFGIEVGPHPWYASANTIGGTLTGNTVSNARQGMNVAGGGTTAAPVRIFANTLTGSPTRATFLCGSRSTSDVNITPDSVVDRNGETAPVTTRAWQTGCQ